MKGGFRKAGMMMGWQVWSAVVLGLLAVSGWYLAMLLYQGCERRERRIKKLENDCSSLEAGKMDWMGLALKQAHQLTLVRERRDDEEETTDREVMEDAGACV